MYREPGRLARADGEARRARSRATSPRRRARAPTSIQLFDSWVGALSPADYEEFVAPYSARILAAVDVPTIHFGTGHRRTLLARDGARRRRRDRPRLAHPARRGLGRASGTTAACRATSTRRVLLGPWERVEAAALDVLARARRPAGPHLQPRPRRAAADRPGRRSPRLAELVARSARRSRSRRADRVRDAVVLMAYGSPERLADVPAYYADIRGGRPIAPEHLDDLVERYRRLGIEDSIPLNAITEETRAALERELGLPVFTGHEALDAADRRRGRARRSPAARDTIVGLVLAPHYSRALDRGLPRPARGGARRPRRARASSRAGTTSPASSTLLADRDPRHRRARRLHRALAAGADPRRGRPVQGPAARDGAPRRRARRRSTTGRSRSRASRRRASRGSARTSSTTSTRCTRSGVERRARLPGRLRLRPPRDPLGHRRRGGGARARARAASSTRIEMPNAEPAFVRVLAGIVRRALAVPSAA